MENRIMTADVENAVEELLRLARLKNYVPTAFIRMRQNVGSVSAISKLMVSANIQTGFLRLLQLGLREHSLEAICLQFPEDFSKQVRECARFRLSFAD